MGKGSGMSNEYKDWLFDREQERKFILKSFKKEYKELKLNIYSSFAEFLVSKIYDLNEELNEK